MRECLYGGHLARVLGPFVLWINAHEFGPHQLSILKKLAALVQTEVERRDA